MNSTPPQEDLNRDLGLGSRVTQQSRQRFLNRDGSFNVTRHGHSFFRAMSPYHWMLSMSWTMFNFLVVAAYLFTNVLFAFGYLLCGASALHGAVGISIPERYLEAFFFSVQTLATIGYGVMSPQGLAANILVSIEALFGLLGFALATGLLFARFSRPSAKIIFSKHAIIAPYREITAFEFRIVNQRSSQLIGVEANVVLARNEDVRGIVTRKFYPLKLEREKVMFFPLHWVVVHPIDALSPLYGVTKEILDASDAEFLIVLTGVDEIFSQTVHSRSSYKHAEVVWNARFADMFDASNKHEVSIDLRKLDDLEQL